MNSNKKDPFYYCNNLSRFQKKPVSFRHTYNFTDDGLEEVHKENITGKFDCIAYLKEKPQVPYVVLKITAPDNKKIKYIGAVGKFLLSNISDIECDPALKSQLLLLLTNQSPES